MERRDRRSNLRSKCRILRRRLPGRAATRDTHVSHKAIRVGIKPALLLAGMKSAVTRAYPPFRFCPRTVEIRQVLGGQCVRASHIGR